MNKLTLWMFAGFLLLVPSFAFAAITINTATVNGGSSAQVEPGDSITVSVTAQLTNGSKWKGTNWGINTSGATPICVNSKNDKDRNSSTDGPYTQVFTITAPALPGLYNLNLTGDGKNNCGDLLGPLYTLLKAVRVGGDTMAPVIAPHSDLAVPGSGTGAVVTYVNPTATDDIDVTVLVTCTPASGSFFPVGNTTVTCTAEDSAGNDANPVTFTVTVIIPDTTSPVIQPHADVTAGATDGAGVVVTYTPPTATDNSGSATVVCVPASGSLFPLGTTQVTCTATDAANNSASTSFNVVVTFVPQPFVMASQPDESNLCAPDWSVCFSGGSSQKYIELGQGSGLGDGTISHVTIAKDENSPFASQPWIISLLCFTEATYATTCPDWVTPNSTNGQQTFVMAEFSTETTDNKHWSAYFTDPAYNSNFNDASSPVAFNPNYYYKLLISDNGWNIGAYGSQTDLYWVLTGMTTP